MRYNHRDEDVDVLAGVLHVFSFRYGGLKLGRSEEYMFKTFVSGSICSQSLIEIIVLPFLTLIWWCSVFVSVKPVRGVGVFDVSSFGTFGAVPAFCTSYRFDDIQQGYFFQ